MEYSSWHEYERHQFQNYFISLSECCLKVTKDYVIYIYLYISYT